MDQFRQSIHLMQFTTKLIIFCSIVYILTIGIEFFYKISFTESLINLGANVNFLVANGEVWRLLTAVFLHGSIIHLFINMYSLNNIGNEIEYVFGKWKLFWIFMLTGVAGNVLSFFLSIWNLNQGYIDPQLFPHISVGASGAIFGLLGYLLGKKLNERKLMMEGKSLNIEMSSLITVVILNLFIGFTVPNIDNNAHIGGFVFGVLLSLFF